MLLRLLVTFLLFALQMEALSLQEALFLAEERSTDILKANIDLDATFGDVVEAASFPNPLFSIDVGTAGFDDLSNDDSAGIVFEIEQLIELGGKRRARICLADVERRRKELAYQTAISRLRIEVEDAYRDLQIQHELANIGRRKVEIAEQILKKSDEKLSAGKFSFQQYSDRIKPLYQYLFAAEDFAFGIQEQEERLKQFLGPSVTFDLLDPLELSFSLEAPYDGEIECLPRAAEKKLLVEAASRLFALEEARAVPDVSVRFDLEQQKGFTGFSVGATVPLPLFNKNEGDRARAWGVWRKAEVDFQQFLKMFQLRLDVAYRRAENKLMQLEKMKSNVVAKAEERVRVYEESYSLGKADEESLLEAKLLLLEANEGYLTLLKEYLESLKQYELLIGSMNE